MRKSAWILALVLFAIIVPAAHADTFADASFSCDTSCIAVPTDPPVTFPSPNIPINFFFQSFNMILNSLDQSSDNYTWGVGQNSSGWFFQINDLTNGQRDFGPTFSYDNHGVPYGSGHVYFDCYSPVPTPEPASAILLLLSLVAIFVMRKTLCYIQPRTV